QEKVHSNGIYAELAGNLYYYSVNYERLFPDQMIGKFGVSIVPEATSFTLMVGKIYGKGKHHLEIGRASCREREYSESVDEAEDGIRDFHVTGVQTCALPIYRKKSIQMEFMQSLRATYITIL